MMKRTFGREAGLEAAQSVPANKTNSERKRRVTMGEPQPANHPAEIQPPQQPTP